jgi:hypothetical protein
MDKWEREYVVVFSRHLSYMELLHAYLGYIGGKTVDLLWFILDERISG